MRHFRGAVRYASNITLVACILPALLSAQVRELPVAFDTAARVRVVTPALADSVGLRSPAWPVAGAYLEARLFKQSEGGYVIAVRRADETVDRYAITLEQLSAIRTLFSMRADLAVPDARATTPAQPPPPIAITPPSPRSSAVPAGFEPGGRSFANGQVLLATAVYGPALAHAMRAAIDDPLAFYAGWFGTIGASLYLANRASNNPKISFAQSIESNHAGLHGAGIGAGLTYLVLNDTTGDRNDGAYGLGIFFGGVGGAAAGYYFAKTMTSAEAAASAFGADVGLLLGVASVVSRNRFDRNWDRTSASTLIGTTVGGYIAGPLYPRMSPDNVTAGDVLALTATGITGILVAGAIVDMTSQDAERAANLLSTGMLVGLAAGHPLLARPVDHTVAQAGIVVVAALGGAYGGANLATLGAREVSTPRVLALAAVGSAAATYLVERRYRTTPAAPKPRARSANAELPRVRFNAVAGILTASRVNGSHPLLRISF